MGADQRFARSARGRLAADPDVAFVCFGGFEPAVWRRSWSSGTGSRRSRPSDGSTCARRRARFALPRSLDKALAALGLPIEKDKEGQRLVRSLSRPNRKTGAYPELTPAIVERVAEYNRIDIARARGDARAGARAS